jgi:hypothetical protein
MKEKPLNVKKRIVLLLVNVSDEFLLSCALVQAMKD